MDPLFKVDTKENLKLWYEDYLYALQNKTGLRIFSLIFVCWCGISSIFMIYSWIKEGQVVLNGKAIFKIVCLTYFLVYDRLFAFLFSLVTRKRVQKNTGRSYALATIQFYEEYMEWSNTERKDIFYYDEVADVHNTKNIIVFDIPKDKCRILVTKKGFVLGTVENFEQFITSKIPR